MGHARGIVELDGKTLVVTRIEVTYTGLEVPDDAQDKVDRVLGVYQDACPVARSLKGSIEITSRLG